MPISLDYTYCYCEENVYKLLERTYLEWCPFDRAYAVVLSSYCVPMELETVNKWKSQVPYCPNADSCPLADATIWDYHVIAVLRIAKGRRWVAIDFDSHLPKATDLKDDLGDWCIYCIPLSQYVCRTFLFEYPESLHISMLQSMAKKVRCRVVERDDYIGWFRSDRGHMLKNTGQYNASPPIYPPIQQFHSSTPDSIRISFINAEKKLDDQRRLNNLVCFINMNNTVFPGTVVNVQDLCDFVSSIS